MSDQTDVLQGMLDLLIGIRMALGARGQQVVWSIARGVAGLIGVGTGVGLVLVMRWPSPP